MATYTVVICKPGEMPLIQKIDASLKGMQDAVQGYIELFLTTETGLDFFCNDEGKLIGLPFNRFFSNDFIAGNILVASHDDEGNTVSLTESQALEAVLMLLGPKII